MTAQKGAVSAPAMAFRILTAWGNCKGWETAGGFFSKRKWKDSSRNWWLFLEVSMSRFDRKNDGFHAATFGTGLKSFQKSCHVHRRIPHEGVKRLRPGTMSGKCD